MGASAILFLLANYQDFFTASLIIESNLVFKHLLHLIKAPFTAIWALMKIIGKNYTWTIIVGGNVVMLLALIL